MPADAWPATFVQLREPVIPRLKKLGSSSLGSLVLTLEAALDDTVEDHCAEQDGQTGQQNLDLIGDELAAIARNSFQAAFLEPVEKAALTKRLDR